jgi:hypothetical protein
MFRKLSITFLIPFLICPQLRALDSGQSEAERLQKLERAVQELQQRNAELEQEVKSLKKMSSFAPEFGAEGKTKTKIISDGKTYVGKNVIAAIQGKDFRPRC